MNKRLSLVVALLLVLALAFTGCARRQAQEEFKFTRSVEIIVPWGAGGGADTTVRAFAPHLERALGVPVVVNNVSGGGGVMGFEHANRQPADGYTFYTYYNVQLRRLSEVVAPRAAWRGQEDAFAVWKDIVAGRNNS